MAVFGGKQKAVDTPEIGINRFLLADGLDPVDGRDLAGVIKARFRFAPNLNQFGIIIVERRGKMGGCARCHPRSDGAAIHHDDGTPGVREFIGGRKPRDARTDHQHIAFLLAG